MKIEDSNPKARYDNMARDLRARGFVDAAEQCERNGISIEAEYRRYEPPVREKL